MNFGVGACFHIRARRRVLLERPVLQGRSPSSRVGEEKDDREFSFTRVAGSIGLAWNFLPWWD